MHDTIVVGGGISGLTTTFLLQRQNNKVLLLEEKKYTGGNIRTLAHNGIRMETGPHGFMGSSEYTWKLIHELGMQADVEPAFPSSKNRYIFRNDRLNPLPMGLVSFIQTPLLSWGSKIRLMLEPFIPNGARDDDTAWDFFCRRFGREAATYIMSPFISGIYAGDVKILGAKAAFPKFWKFEKESGSMIRGALKYMREKRKRLRNEGMEPKRGLFSFREGLGKITHKLSEELSDCIRTGHPVENIRKENGYYIVESTGNSWKSRSVILATPPADAARIMKNCLSGSTDSLASILMAPVILLHWLARDEKNTFPDGFGFLMPRHFNYRVLGTLFPSRLFSARAPRERQLFASFYGGMTDPGIMALDDHELKSLLFKEHNKIFHNELKGAEVIKILRYPTAIPQLLPDHPNKIKHFKERLSSEMPGIALAGNYLTGVGIEHAVESGYKAADQTLRFLLNELRNAKDE